MPSVIDRLTRRVLRPQIQEIERMTGQLVEAYKTRPTPLSPESFVASLSEMDPQYLEFLLRRLREEGITDTPNESARLQAVQESRSLYTWDVITQAIIDLWTDYGFGVHIDITPRDKKAKEVWDGFWDDYKNSVVLNDRDIQTLSRDVLQDGEFYFTFFISTLDGKVIVRTVPTEQIKEVITDPGDSKVPLYYRREYTGPESLLTSVYYPDWRATPEDLGHAKLSSDANLADSIQPATTVLMMQVAHRKTSNRGWPLMTAGAAWSRAYKNFLQDRAAVSKAVATYVDKIVAKSGTRGIAALKASLESSLTRLSGTGMETNPNPVAGSTWIENEAVTRERMNLGTGAADAEKDGAPLLAQAGLAGRIYPHYLGRGEAFRLATATAMEGPTYRAFNRYQLFWSSVWQDMAEVVFRAYETYSPDGVELKDHTVDVNTDAIIDMDIKSVAVIDALLVNAVNNGALADNVTVHLYEQLLKSSFQTLGVKSVDDLWDTLKGEEKGLLPALLKPPKPAPVAQPQTNPFTGLPANTAVPPGGNGNGNQPPTNLTPNPPAPPDQSGQSFAYPGSETDWNRELFEQLERAGLRTMEREDRV